MIFGLKEGTLFAPRESAMRLTGAIVSVAIRKDSAEACMPTGNRSNGTFRFLRLASRAGHYLNDRFVFLAHGALNAYYRNVLFVFVDVWTFPLILLQPWVT